MHGAPKCQFHLQAPVYHVILPEVTSRLWHVNSLREHLCLRQGHQTTAVANNCYVSRTCDIEEAYLVFILMSGIM